jgi:heme/copper-type cytochrome/quinol oxidase subunit 2
MLNKNRHAVPLKQVKKNRIEDFLFNTFLFMGFSLSLIIIALSFAIFFI